MQQSCCARHAEISALKQLGRHYPDRPKKLVAYVTKKPCAQCEVELVKYNIHSVYWQELYDVQGCIVDFGHKELK
jgi:deoxycytidylate deaminase